jgi:hypothetical protein
MAKRRLTLTITALEEGYRVTASTGILGRREIAAESLERLIEKVSKLIRSELGEAGREP